MKKLVLLTFMTMLIMASCKRQEVTTSNPFFSEYDTPFQVPPFDQIDTTHYIPAFEKAIATQQAMIDEIVSNSEAPTFENTILPLEKSGELLTKVSRVFFSLNSAETNPTMQALARKIAPMTTQNKDNISLNDKLFQKIKSIYGKMEDSGFDAEQKRVVNKYYEDFVRNGADLNETDKEKLRELNQQLSKKGLKFGENLLAETNDNFKLIIDNPEDLSGLPQGVIAAAAENANKIDMEGKWMFSLQKPSWIPFLQYADNRDLREKIYRGYFMRGDNNDEFDNKDIMKEIANLRAERAKLLGYRSHADYVISKNMAKTPENVYEFLNNMMEPALLAAKRDRGEMQQIIDREGGDFKLASWDWWYYAEKLKKEKYNLDESEVKPYLALDNVRDGMFDVAKQLYGLTFNELSDMPVYHPEVEVFEVKDENGDHLAVLYLDYHPRPGKRVGAWCGRFRPQSYKDGKKIMPVVTIVCNFTRPTGDAPALLTWDETLTLFHEFGHALHGFFTDGKYSRIAGNLPRDMIELPSQIMENWAGQPEVLKEYARHYQTGEVMPQDLIDRLQKSSTFNEAFNTVEYIAASYLDLDWHRLEEPTDKDVLAFEKEAMDNIKLMEEIIPRYRTSYFSHIVGGYAAGYYVYDWAAVLDTDAFQAFVDSGDLFNKEIAAKFRKHVLTEGGVDEGMTQYLKFRGQDPSIDPLLKKRGLDSK